MSSDGFVWTDEELEAAESEGPYGAIPVPIDLTAKLADWEWYDNTADGRSEGLFYKVVTANNPDHNGLEFRYYIWFPPTNRARERTGEFLRAAAPEYLIKPDDGGKASLDEDGQIAFHWTEEIANEIKGRYVVINVDYPWAYRKAIRDGKEDEYRDYRGERVPMKGIEGIGLIDDTPPPPASQTEPPVREPRPDDLDDDLPF